MVTILQASQFLLSKASQLALFQPALFLQKFTRIFNGKPILYFFD